jgi:hypothetical protein
VGLLPPIPACFAEAAIPGPAGGYVVLTDLAETDPFFAAARKLQAYRSAQLISFPHGRPDEALKALKQAQPTFVAVVVRPETLEVNFAYEILELAAKLDDDPFVDFAYGFITGATAADALELVERTIEAERKAIPAVPRLIAFGPTSTPQADDGNAFEWLKGWRTKRIEHKPGNFPPENLPDLAEADVVRFWGHGGPDGVDGGLAQSDLSSINIRARIVFAGPCFSAVTRNYFDELACGKHLEALSVDADKSLALSFLSKGAVAYFGALQEDRCISAGQEMEQALTSGAPVGLVLKQLQDRIALSLPNRSMHFSRLEAGAMPPKEKGVEAQLRLYAARVLLGDPAFVPFPAQIGQALKTETLAFPTGFVVEAIIGDPKIRSTFVDSFRDDLCTCGTDNDTLYLRVSLPEQKQTVVGVRRVTLPTCLESAKHGSIKWKEESWAGERFLHLQLDFKHDTLAEIAPGTVIVFEVDTACTCRPPGTTSHASADH